MKKLLKSGVSFIILLSLIACEKHTQIKEISLINTKHLDFLYENITVDGINMGIIHIYANAPEYKWTDDADEGIACVDDAARAAQFYMKYYSVSHDSNSAVKAKKLLRFIIHLQAKNGYFYNFIWPDHSINTTYKTSVAEPNWWTWRAIAALTDGYKFFRNYDQEFSGQILKTLRKVFETIKSNIPVEKIVKNYYGFDFPSWLPSEIASDQASILLGGIITYLEDVEDSTLRQYVSDLADGIVSMQVNDHKNTFDKAFFSWKNVWHAYGNLQSYTLLRYCNIMDTEKYKDAALDEINIFYSSQIENLFLNSFVLTKDGGNIIIEKSSILPQIAYNIRPMVYACLEAYKLTGDSSYAMKAGNLGTWFFGNNLAQATMYNQQNGMCYDGIIDNSEINMNSGAESTVEALMAILAIEQNPIANKVLQEYIKSNLSYP